MKTLVIIDDNIDFLELLDMVFRRDYTIIQLASFEEVCNTNFENEPNCIIVDNNLGPIKADEVLDKLKEKLNLSEIPTILISGDVNAENSLIKNKCTAFLAKPFKMKEIRSLVKDLQAN